MLLDLPNEILVQVLLYLTQSHPPSAVHCAWVHPCQEQQLVLTTSPGVSLSQRDF